jgi:hypothetical protein
MGFDPLTSPLTTRPNHSSPIDLDTQEGPSPTELGFIVHKPNPNWAPEKFKAQLKWAPAASKDGSDYDPPSPVTNS